MVNQFERMKILGNFKKGIASAGSALASATICPADHVTVTTVTEGQGVKLAPGNKAEFRTVANHSTTANLLVYPPTSSGAFNGATAGAAITVPSNHAAMFMFFDANVITAFVW